MNYLIHILFLVLLTLLSLPHFSEHKFSKLFLAFLSLLSCLFNLFISISCSLSFPNEAAVVRVVRSRDSEIFLTLGCHVLPNHFRTLIFNSFMSKVFPRPMRWFTICENFAYLQLFSRFSPTFKSALKVVISSKFQKL